jgi:hypothetical protein
VVSEVDGMRDADWPDLDDQALERLLVERWLYRGMLLGVVLLVAVAVTYLGVRGIAGLVDRLTVVLLVALGLSAGGVAFGMRVHDHRIYRELRQRRASPGRSAGPGGG